MKRHPPPSAKSTHRSVSKNASEINVLGLFKVRRKLVKRFLGVVRFLNTLAVAKSVMITLLERFPNATSVVIKGIKWVWFLLKNYTHLL